MNWQTRIPRTSRSAAVLLLALALNTRSGAQPAVPEVALSPRQAITIAVDTIWEARPHWSQEGYGTLRAATAATEQVRTFEVHAPGQSAVWWRPFDQPVPVASFPLVRLRLRAAGLSPDSQGYLVSLLLRESDGKTTRMRGILAPDELAGGQPEEPRDFDLRTLGEFEAVLGVKIELWAATQGAMSATLSLLPIAFLADGAPPAAAESPETEFAFVVRDRKGNPIPNCQVAIDYENLNARMPGTTDASGRVVLKTRHPAPIHTASFHAPGFLPLELAELDAAETTEVALVPACRMSGTLYLEGQPVPGIVHIDTKTPRAVFGRFPRVVFAAADRQGQWQADVPAEAFAWLVRAGAHGGGTLNDELNSPDLLDQWSRTLNLPRTNDTEAWLAPTPAWLLREGDNDTVAAMADDGSETAGWRTKALAALASVALSDPGAGDYYLLDLARLAARPTDQPYAGQAADCLLAVLRRAGVQPAQAADYLQEKADGSIPAALRQLLGKQTAAWDQVIGKVAEEDQPTLAGDVPPARRVSDRETVTITSFRTSSRSPSVATATTPATRGGGIDLFSSRRTQPKEPQEDADPRREPTASRSTGAIDFGAPATRTAQTSAANAAIAGTSAATASDGGLALPTGGNSPSRAAVPVLSPARARDGAGGMVSFAPAPSATPAAASFSPPPADIFTVTLPSPSRTTTASASLPAAAPRDQGESIRIAPERARPAANAPWAFARAPSSSVKIGSPSSDAHGAVTMPGAPGAARDVLTLDFTSLADARTAAVENTLIRSQWERIAALVQQADHAKARAEALALAGRLTTQNAILAYIPLLALTETDPGTADRNAVSACLDAMAKSDPRIVANAYAACLLHCYRRGDFDFAQELHARYRTQFPAAKPSPAVLLALALCHIKRGELDQAHTHFAAIVRDFPATDEAPRAALLLGWIDLSRQKYPEARATLEALVRSYPANPCADKARQILLQMPEAAE